MSYRILDPDYEYPLTDNGRYLLRFRYLEPRSGGGYESPEELFRRVAWNLAEAERAFQPGLSDEALVGYADRFFTVMTDARFLPNAPALLGAGRPLQQLAACFVLPVGDSIDEVFNALRMAALVHSHGGGTGFSFSRLRSAGARIRTGGSSTGPVPFLQVFDAETEVIKRGGTGWGANMGVLRCDHPDIRQFIRAKSRHPHPDCGLRIAECGLGSGGPGQSAIRNPQSAIGGRPLRNFNLSVGITEAFMQLYRQDGELPLVDPQHGEAVDTVPARELFRQICEAAWETGDPGLLFLDRINEDNPTPHLGWIEATNPCGEAPLLPYESCCLGAFNVSRFLGPGGEMLWSKLEATAATAMRMMDNLIEVNRYPLPEIEAATKRNRKVGVGVMGFADLLIGAGIPYDSPAAESLARELMRRIRAATLAASAALAEERGSFPEFEASSWRAKGYHRLRNATTTSNAPNSTISVVAGCSAGIEPLFSISYEKQLANGDRLTEVHRGFLDVARERGFYSDDLVERLRVTGSVQQIQELPADVRRVFVTSHDIEPAWHIRIQSAFQECTDLGVSKTINLPHTATVEDVRDAFLAAHELGCKGITCFRDGCLEEQFLAVSDRGQGSGGRSQGSGRTRPRPRPRKPHDIGEALKDTTGV